jgi:hypothetical protein
MGIVYTMGFGLSSVFKGVRFSEFLEKLGISQSDRLMQQFFNLFWVQFPPLGAYFASVSGF